MMITSLEGRDFRNYASFSLSFGSGVNIFFGDNAQGKTNLLEAIYLLGTARSHRCSKDSELIRFEHQEAHLRMRFTKHHVNHQMDMHLRRGQGKGIALDGQVARRSADVIGIANMIFFSPEDLNLVKNAPGERRRFMDIELCQLDRSYVYAFTSYRRALLQRNSILKQAASRRDLADTLSVWDEMLLQHGRRLIEARQEFVEEIGKTAGQMHRYLSGNKEKLDVVYKPSVYIEEYKEKLKASAAKDLERRQTTVGPHKDDIVLKINNRELRHFGSQGQQRTAALSLKLAEISLVRHKANDTPVLLLDDVLSELDRSRQEHLLDHINGIQTFVSCTGLEEFILGRLNADHVFCVKEGNAEWVQNFV